MEQLSARNDSSSIKLCLPKLNRAYFILSITTFVAAPMFLTSFGRVDMTNGKDWSCCTKIILYSPLYFVLLFIFIYLYLPILAICHGIQVTFPCKLPYFKLPSIPVSFIFNLDDTSIPLDDSSIPFLKFFEQFGEALPQFIIGVIFYVNNSYFINTYDTLFETQLPITLLSVIFSGVSVVFGLITSFVKAGLKVSCTGVSELIFGEPSRA